MKHVVLRLSFSLISERFEIKKLEILIKGQRFATKLTELSNDIQEYIEQTINTLSTEIVDIIEAEPASIDDTQIVELHRRLIIDF